MTSCLPGVAQKRAPASRDFSSHASWLALLPAFADTPGLADVIACSDGRVRIKIGGAYCVPKTHDHIRTASSWSDLCTLVCSSTLPMGQTDFSRDGGCTIGNKRFRYSRVKTHSGEEFTLRPLPLKIPAPNSIHLPPSLVQAFCDLKDGLIAVSGTTGNGKSTTIASLVAENAKRQALRVVTIEDPVEYLHEEAGNGSIFTYRSVGVHTPSFASGVRDALRMNPDVIVLGEVRDSATAAVLVEAALSGHKVVTTIHGGSVEEGMQRLGDFAAEIGPSALSGLAQAFRICVAQRLVPSVGVSGGLVPLHEILVGTSSVCSKIRSGRFFTLRQEIETGRERGMQGFADSSQAKFALYSPG